MLRRSIHHLLARAGYRLIRLGPHRPDDAEVLDSRDRAILETIEPYTMTSWERQLALIHCVRHVARRRIPGCFVECGVWRGGSVMAMAMALMQEGDAQRRLYLYDTFDGMPVPGQQDGASAREQFDQHLATEGAWCHADLADVQRNVGRTGYPPDRIVYVKGMVESTIPETLPAEPIALLRLDTDWYESTRRELEYLAPLIVEGGALLIDDYGHWAGARQAVDEYLAGLPRSYYLHRVDRTGRLIWKL